MDLGKVETCAHCGKQFKALLDKHDEQDCIDGLREENDDLTEQLDYWMGKEQEVSRWRDAEARSASARDETLNKLRVLLDQGRAAAVEVVSTEICPQFNAAPAGGRGEEEKQVAQMAQSARRGET